MTLLPVLLLFAGCKPVLQGSGESLAARRQEMVEKQILARDIRSERVVEAMASVPRHEFVTAESRDSAYDDEPLPIGYGQTISQPYVVAFMTELIDPHASDRVLEIGTGSGYQAAILSRLVKEVYSVELIEPLAKGATELLARLGYANVKVRAGDGYEGWPEAAPFDTIIVTCAPEQVPKALVTQLKENGKMVIPVGKAGAQQLYYLVKRNGVIERQAVLPVRFVPMIAGKNDNAARGLPAD